MSFGLRGVLSIGGGGSVGSTPTFTTISLGAAPAAAGAIRMSNAGDIAWRNAANSADAGGIHLDSTGTLQLGRTSAAVYATAVNVNPSANTLFSVSGNAYCAVGSSFGGLGFYSGFTTITTAVNVTSDLTVGIPARVADLAPRDTYLRAQSAWSSATTFKDGGFVNIQGGSWKDSTGKRGGVRLQYNQSTSENAIECADLGTRRVIGLLTGAALTTTEATSGDGYLIVKAATTAPTSDPPAGYLFVWFDSAAGKFRVRVPGGGTHADLH